MVEDGDFKCSGRCILGTVIRDKVNIGVNFYKAARLKPPHFLGSEAFRPLSPPLFAAAFSQNEG